MGFSSSFVYYGTSAFSATILQGLVDSGFTPELVVTTKGKPASRGLKTTPTPVGTLAGFLQLPLREVASLRPPEVEASLKQYQTPFAVLAAFGKIVPLSILDLYPKGIVNVHPSLLPKYRGPSPIQSALKNGDSQTGVSLIVLDSEVDHGPLLAQRTLPITEADDALTLSTRLASSSMDLLKETLPPYISGSLQPAPQDHAEATFTTMVEREDGQADFTKPAQTLDRMRRAFTPWPGLWTTWQGKRLKLVATEVAETKSGNPGTVTQDSDGLQITCGQGALVVSRLQLEGATELTASDFVRGHQGLVSSVLPS